MRSIIVAPATAMAIFDSDEIETLDGDKLNYMTNAELFEVNEFAQKYQLNVLGRLVEEMVWQQARAQVMRERAEMAKRHYFRRGLVIGLCFWSLMSVAQLVAGNYNHWVASDEAAKSETAKNQTRAAVETAAASYRLVADSRTVAHGDHTQDTRRVPAGSGGAGDPAVHRPHGNGTAHHSGASAAGAGRAGRMPAIDRPAPDAGRQP